jgi:hypothetical protein
LQSRGELADLLFDEGADFDGRTDLLRVWPHVNDFALQLFRAIVDKFVQRSFGTSISFTANHQRRVDDDARQPSGERGAALKGLQIRERSAKTILHCVLRVFFVPQDGEGNSAELAALAREYLFMSVRISINRLLHEVRVVSRGRGRNDPLRSCRR